ncbi:MAG: 50S ribosomal protein L9 [Candidatus Absconditabacterales bacterium]
MRKIEVLLLQDFKTLGKKYDVVLVRPSYAKNVLFPKQVARFADAGTLNDLRAKMEAHRKTHQTFVDKLKVAIKDLEDKGMTITAEANEQGKLYGAVHAKDIAAQISSQYGVDLDTEYLHTPDIHTHGAHQINFNGEGIMTEFTVNVTAK